MDWTKQRYRADHPADQPLPFRRGFVWLVWEAILAARSGNPLTSAELLVLSQPTGGFQDTVSSLMLPPSTRSVFSATILWMSRVYWRYWRERMNSTARFPIIPPIHTQILKDHFQSPYESGT